MTERPEGYYHQKLEPPEEPPFCDRCFGYHASFDCPEMEEPEDECDECGSTECVTMLRLDRPDGSTTTYLCPDCMPNPVCPMCGGVGVALGALGILHWFRCRQCGADFSLKAE
jgi:hypothetical protein